VLPARVFFSPRETMQNDDSKQFMTIPFSIEPVTPSNRVMGWTGTQGLTDSERAYHLQLHHRPS
jgi:hypothetical protein